MNKKIIIGLIIVIFVISIFYVYHRYTHQPGKYPPEPSYEIGFVEKNIPEIAGNFYLAKDSIDRKNSKFICIGNITDAAYLSINGKIERLENFEESTHNGIETLMFANKDYYLEIYNLSMDSLFIEKKTSTYDVDKKIYSHLIKSDELSARLSIEQTFSEKVYDPFFEKNHIVFDCEKCEAPTIEMQVVIDDKGKYLSSICKELESPLFSCTNINSTIIKAMQVEFPKFFKSYHYPLELRGKKITFILRPQYLLKC